MNLNSSDKVMIVGFTGMGKTYLMRHLIRQFLAQKVKVIVYDSEHQHGDLAREGALVYTPKTTDTSEFDKLCGVVWSKYPNSILAVESIDFYALPSDIGMVRTPNFKKLVHWGRGSKGIGLILTSRRIASVHKDPCSQCKHWYIFRTFLPNDVDYMKKFVGVTAKKAIDLDDFYFLYWSKGQSQICSPIPKE